MIIRHACLTVLLYAVAVSAAHAADVPVEVTRRLQEIYAEKYPDNPLMRESLIRGQIQAYRDLEKWKSERGVPQDVFDKLRETYKRKYPENYTMQKALLESAVATFLEGRD
ncbi:MAG: hypothetical protein KAI66_25400 [Lentisphaeria bacterium]|nr:hypothetical protein [Lentisphaeria bacterium]